MRILCFPFTECKKAVPWKNYLKKSIFVFAIMTLPTGDQKPFWFRKKSFTPCGT